jgi:hypothetical protein
MPMSDDPTEATDRLEEALERIAALASRRQQAAAPPATAEVAGRLDSLIAELRAALARSGA